MSRAAQTGEALPETALRNPSFQARSLHRPDEDADELRPACSEGDYREDVDWKAVDVAAKMPHWGLCRNPECYGGERR